jgi:hypothetical protein
MDLDETKMETELHILPLPFLRIPNISQGQGAYCKTSQSQIVVGDIK